MSKASANQTLPVVFIYKGGDSYLACSITQARESNPDADIYLIGDRFNRGFPGIKHLEWRDFAEQASALEKIYQHRNTNPYHYEIFCLQRWLILNEFVQQNALPGCLYLDSDVLLYERLEKIAASLRDVDWTTHGWSPHFTLWQKPEALEQYCAFMLESYKDPVAFSRLEQRYIDYQAAGRRGGVSDMTVFEHFAAQGQFRVRDLAEVTDIMASDHAIGQDEGCFEMRKSIKRIEWRDGMPWGHHLPTDRWVQFQSLHFQGPSRGHIFRQMRIQTPRWRLLHWWNRMVAKKGKYTQKWERRLSKP